MITFYYRSRDYDPLPGSLAEYADWQAEIARRGGLIGPACWTVQTHLQLKQRGFESRLTQQRPEEGAVITHFDDMPAQRSERGRAYWICVLADRTNIQPFANSYIVQNPYQVLRTRQRCFHVLHWKQPGIVARATECGNRFSRIRFFGERVSLAPEFTDPQFTDWCRREGLDFDVVAREHWHDYSDCDAVIGLRTLGPAWVHDKPPSKLVNAWLAGVPAVLGRESSFRALGRVGEDYLEATTMEEVKQALLMLRDDPARRNQLVAAGREQVGRASDDAVSQMWMDTIRDQILPRAQRWQRHAMLRRAHFAFERLLEGLAWRFQLLDHRFEAQPGG